MAIEVFCKAESRTIGSVEAPVGVMLDAKRFVQSYRATSPAYSFGGSRLENHTQLLCPKCGNPLLFKQPPEDPDSKPTGIYAVLGNMRAAS